MTFDESAADAWKLRYGAELDRELPELDRFLTHRSVRSFADRPVSEDVIAGLVAAAQSAATSSNLQLWSVISVQEPSRREEIAMLCSNQHQVRHAPWFFGFFADHHRLRQFAEAVQEPTEALGHTEFLLMAVIDAALAAERMVCAAEAIGLGTCYIGALRNHPDQVQSLLHLPRGVFGLFGLCVGYPNEEKPTEIKPRLKQESVWFRETYPEKLDAAEYDARMSEFYRAQGMKDLTDWSIRSARRARIDQLSGREILKEWLNGQGMGEF